MPYICCVFYKSSIVSCSLMIQMCCFQKWETPANLKRAKVVSNCLKLAGTSSFLYFVFQNAAREDIHSKAPRWLHALYTRFQGAKRVGWTAARRMLQRRFHESTSLAQWTINGHERHRSNGLGPARRADRERSAGRSRLTSFLIVHLAVLHLKLGP